MDADLVLIFGFVLVIASIALGVGSAIHRRTNEHEERKLELQARLEEAKLGRGASGEAHQKLEERVRVLERIATDSNHALASQIDQLRDLDQIDEFTSSKEKVQ